MTSGTLERLLVTPANGFVTRRGRSVEGRLRNLDRRATLDRTARRDWRGGRSFVLADGARVELRGAELDDRKPWSCSFRITGQRFFRGFTVTELGVGEAHMARFLEAGSWREVDYRQGTLMQASSPDGSGSLAVWRGRWHELHTGEAGPGRDLARLTRALDALRFEDTPDGMLVRPRAGTGLTVYDLTATKAIPGIGVLQVQDARGVRLPAWAGRPTAHGEAWQQRLGGGTAGGTLTALVYATPTAVAHVYPDQGKVDLSEVLARLGGLDLVWTPAPAGG